MIDLLIAAVIALTPADNNTDNCTHQTPCLNGNVPSYDNPNCWPGAIYCPPADSPEDVTVTLARGHGGHHGHSKAWWA